MNWDWKIFLTIIAAILFGFFLGWLSLLKIKSEISKNFEEFGNINEVLKQMKKFEKNFPQMTNFSKNEIDKMIKIFDTNSRKDFKIKVDKKENNN